MRNKKFASNVHRENQFNVLKNAGIYGPNNAGKTCLMDHEKHGHAYAVLHELSGMNAKTNENIGKLADHMFIAIEQKNNINQDIHHLKGKVTSNIGSIIDSIMKDNPSL